jgi:hypothetical protein
VRIFQTQRAFVQRHDRLNLCFSTILFNKIPRAISFHGFMVYLLIWETAEASCSSVLETWFMVVLSVALTLRQQSRLHVTLAVRRPHGIRIILMILGGTRKNNYSAVITPETRHI